MPDPLIFLCIREPGPAEGPFVHRLLTTESPTGPVFVAFDSRQMASLVVKLFGLADGVYLWEETSLTPEIVGTLGEARVVLVREGYLELQREDFPWLDRVITYDFAAALARRAGESGPHP